MIEKALGIRRKQLAGVASSETWSQVRWESFGGRGFFMLLSLDAVLDGGDVMDSGRDLMEDVVEEARKTEIGAEWISEIVEQLKDKIGGNGSVMIGQILGTEEGKRSIFVGGVGEMKVLLLRGGQEVAIWSGGESVSGWLLEGDELVMGSGEFFENVWRVGMDEVEMMARLTEVENSAKVVGMVVGVKELMGVRHIEQEVASVMEESSAPKIGMKVTGESEMGKLWRKMRRKWGLDAGQIKLRKESVNRRNLGLMIGLVFLVIFLVSVVIGSGRRAVKREADQYAQVSEPIEFSLEEAIRVKQVNPVRSRSLVLEARKGVADQGDRFIEGRMSEKWNELKGRVESVWREVSGEVVVSGTKWLDVGVFKDGIKIDGMDISDGRALLLGRDVRVVVGVDLDDKSGGVVAGGEVLAGVVGVAGRDDGVLVLRNDEIVVTDDKGVEESRLDLEGVRGRIIRGFGISTYVVADEDLFKFPGTGNGYGKRRRFLNPGVLLDTNKVVDMAIDGEVWLLEVSGRVRRLNQGVVESFELKTVEDWGEPKSLMVSEEMNRVWVWDKGMGAVIEFDRESGEYVRKIIWEGFGDASAVGFDESGKRLMVARGGELWVVGL